MPQSTTTSPPSSKLSHGLRQQQRDDLGIEQDGPFNQKLAAGNGNNAMLKSTLLNCLSVSISISN